MAGQVVVTGGAGCIGLAICRRILAAGQTPVALDLAAAIAAVDWDSPETRGIVPLAGDVTDRASLEAAARELSPAGPLAGLVNCAGVLKDTYLGRMSDAAMNLMFQVNVAGMARVTDVFAPLLADGSAIVNIGSLTGHIGRLVGASVYGATKAGVSAYTTYLAVELAPRKIRVNCIAPGATASHAVRDSADDEGWSPDRALSRQEVPGDIVGSVVFLLCDMSAFVTGQTLVVDGGSHLH